MTLIAEDLKELAERYTNLAGAIDDFVDNHPGAGRMTVAQAAERLASANLQVFLAVNPDEAGTQLRTLVDRLGDTSDMLAQAAVTEALHQLQASVRSLSGAAKDAAVVVARIAKAEHVVNVAVAALGVGTAVAAVILAPSPGTIEAVIKGTEVLRASLAPAATTAESPA